MNIQYKPTKDGPAWRVWWETKDPSTGKRKRLSEMVHGTKAQARKRWTERQKEIDAKGKAYREESKEPVGQYLTRWLAGKTPDLRATTAQQYAWAVNGHILPHIGAVPLREPTPDAVQTMVDELRAGGLGTSSVSTVRSILRIALQDAVRRDLITSNPVDRTRGPRQAKRHVVAFTVDQIDALLTQAEGTRLAPLLRFAAYSGLRRGEVLALHWEDVDREQGRVTVRRSRVAVRGGAETHEPKTEAGKRSVALPSPAVEALNAAWLQQAKDRLAAGEKWHDEGLVFTTATGGALSPTNVSRDFRRIRDGAGLPPLPLHSLRHTAVSVQIAAGVPLEVVSKRIGHRRLSITADTYGHLLPEADQGAADAVDAFLAGRKTTKRTRN